MSYVHTPIVWYIRYVAELLSRFVSFTGTWGDTSEQLLLKAYPIVLSNCGVRVEIEVDVHCENAPH